MNQDKIIVIILIILCIFLLECIYNYMKVNVPSIKVCISNNYYVKADIRIHSLKKKERENIFM